MVLVALYLGRRGSIFGKQIRNNKSSVCFVLPISFFIKNRNKSVKEEILKYFSTVTIYQNNKKWSSKNIPCCFAIFTNSKKYKNNIVVVHQKDSDINKQIFNIKDIHEELIPLENLNDYEKEKEIKGE